jgi:hypothetical protein
MRKISRAQEQETSLTFQNAMEHYAKRDRKGAGGTCSQCDKKCKDEDECKANRVERLRGNAAGSVFESSAAKTANQYIVPRKGKWVILQKGTGKELSEHDTKEKAEASFRAMEMHKHMGSAEVTEENWRDALSNLDSDW